MNIRLSAPLLLLAVLLFAAPASAATLGAGSGRFEVEHRGRKLPVWYYLPKDAAPDTPIMVVMHGVNRDADRYRNDWMPHAQRYGFILVCPEFSKQDFPSDEGYALGMESAGAAFTFIEPVFDAVKQGTGNTSESYYLYGHSAGAQFVHRFVFFNPKARVAKAVAANAGWWTLPSAEVDFPYGLRNAPAGEVKPETLVQRPLVVLLGTADTEANHVHLRRTPEAMAQGEHRFARGQHFFATGRKRAEELKVPFGWHLITAPGVGHQDAGMSAYAVRWLFGQPPILARVPERVRVLFGGDTGMGESYQEQYAAEGGVNILEVKGYAHGIMQLRPMLAAVDFSVINLETPLTNRRESPLKGKDYIHYSDPVKLPALFAPFGPVAFSMANNHTLDHGVEGLDDTRAALNDAGAAWFGGDSDLKEAARPLVQEFRLGDDLFTLAVFGAFEYRKDYDENYRFYAGVDRGGCAPVDVPAVKKAIAELRASKPDACVVYFVHWGGNYTWKNEEQTATAKALREAGVDLVIGHGAHMMQEVVHDGRGWIFYSLGNFVFQSRGRYGPYHAAPFSLPLIVDFSKKNGRVQATLRAYPIVCDNQLTGYQSRLVTEIELSAVDAMLADKSGWDEAVRAAVKRGADEIGPYLEFTEPEKK